MAVFNTVLITKVSFITITIIIPFLGALSSSSKSNRSILPSLIDLNSVRIVGLNPKRFTLVWNYPRVNISNNHNRLIYDVTVKSWYLDWLDGTKKLDRSGREQVTTNGLIIPDFHPNTLIHVVIRILSGGSKSNSNGAISLTEKTLISPVILPTIPKLISHLSTYEATTLHWRKPVRKLFPEILKDVSYHITWREISTQRIENRTIDLNTSEIFSITRRPHEIDGVGFNKITFSLEILHNLEPNTRYMFAIQASHPMALYKTPATSAIVTTANPGQLRLLQVDEHTLKFLYSPPHDHNIKRLHKTILCPFFPGKKRRTRPVQKCHEQSLGTKIFSGKQYVVKYENLRSNHLYSLQFNLNSRFPVYSLNSTNYSMLMNIIYPISKKTFSFRTSKGVPYPPSQPKLIVFPDSVIRVQWNAPINNGGHDILRYTLYQLIEFINVTSSLMMLNNQSTSVPYQTQQSEWAVVYRGNATFWRTNALKDVSYQFKVRAENQLGISDYSVTSISHMEASIKVPFSNNTGGNDRTKNGLTGSGPNGRRDFQSSGLTIEVVATVAAVGFGMILLCLILLIVCRRRSNKLKKMALVHQRMSALMAAAVYNPASGGVSLADAVVDNYGSTLAGTIDGEGHIKIKHNNELYFMSLLEQMDSCENLRQISRKGLKLNSFLGSGAFGEVYEGTLLQTTDRDEDDDITADDKIIPVAIKTLKKTSDVREIQEFLKEAAFMSNFQHEHIVKLLGICLDGQPFYMILELLEGGDLLTFLRSARYPPHSPKSSADVSCGVSGAMKPALNAIDLLDICLQVSRGCWYLEQCHFVHRDIAARNCLVSTKSHQEFPRVIKIADFGLARDVYRNDYYRKEGEGLLPVRWMPPEALLDGIFTTHSDVWAFGVLMWEVMTFGQQPYPAYSNVEVFNLVRGGGRLDKPATTSPQMFSMMGKCWSEHPRDRPSFKDILNQLEVLHDDLTLASELGYLDSEESNIFFDCSMIQCTPPNSGINNELFNCANSNHLSLLASPQSCSSNHNWKDENVIDTTLIKQNERIISDANSDDNDFITNRDEENQPYLYSASQHTASTIIGDTPQLRGHRIHRQYASDEEDFELQHNEKLPNKAATLKKRHTLQMPLLVSFCGNDRTKVVTTAGTITKNVDAHNQLYGTDIDISIKNDMKQKTCDRHKRGNLMPSTSTNTTALVVDNKHICSLQHPHSSDTVNSSLSASECSVLLSDSFSSPKYSQFENTSSDNNNMTFES